LTSICLPSGGGSTSVVMSSKQGFVDGCPASEPQAIAPQLLQRGCRRFVEEQASLLAPWASEDLLHEVCAPFFAEMVLAAQAAVVQLKHASHSDASTSCSDAEAPVAAARSRAESKDSSTESMESCDVEGVATCAELPPLFRLTGEASKKVSVCCHWKNKGWCKYQSSCKFAHPEHKRGAGLKSQGDRPAPVPWGKGDRVELDGCVPASSSRAKVLRGKSDRAESDTRVLPFSSSARVLRGGQIDRVALDNRVQASGLPPAGQPVGMAMYSIPCLLVVPAHTWVSVGW